MHLLLLQVLRKGGRLRRHIVLRPWHERLTEGSGLRPAVLLVLVLGMQVTLRHLCPTWVSGGTRARWWCLFMMAYGQSCCTCSMMRLSQGSRGSGALRYVWASIIWWPNMRGDVASYLQACVLCQRSKPEG